VLLLSRRYPVPGTRSAADTRASDTSASTTDGLAGKEFHNELILLGMESSDGLITATAVAARRSAATTRNPLPWTNSLSISASPASQLAPV